jgi:hypothetical protein
MQVEADLIELDGPAIGKCHLRPPDIWSQADAALAKLSATQSDGSFGRRVHYRIVFSDAHDIEGDMVVTEVPPVFAGRVQRELELIAGNGSEPFFFTVQGRPIVGLDAYIDFLKQAEATGDSERAKHELETYAIGDSSSTRHERSGPAPERLASAVEARVAWEERTGQRAQLTEEDRLRRLSERLELAETFCRSLVERGNPFYWPEGGAYRRWRAMVYPPGEFFKVRAPVVDTSEGRRLGKRLELAEELVEAAALAQSSDTESDVRRDREALLRAYRDWKAESENMPSAG